MSRITVTVKDKNILEKANRALLVEINAAIKKSLPKLQQEARELTVLLMSNSRFYIDLLFGDLPGHFSIAPGRQYSVAREIIEEIGNNVEIIFTPFTGRGGKIKGSLQIGIGKNDFSSLLDLDAGKTTTRKGQLLEWLRWVLTEGDKVIISGFEIEFIPGKGISKQALMFENPLESWRVPPHISGTIKDNFITRELTRQIEAYNILISDTISKKLFFNV